MDEATYRRMLVEKADISESDSEVEEDEIEDYLDGCSSPDQRTSKYWSPAYQARREARKEVQQARRHARRNLRRHAMSPPATPPHAQGLKQTTTANHAIPMLDLSQKSKRKSVVRKAPRRPTTRSQGSDKVVLLPEKGMVRCWVWWMRWSYVDMSYETYLRDFVSGYLDMTRDPTLCSC